MATGAMTREVGRGTCRNFEQGNCFSSQKLRAGIYATTNIATSVWLQAKVERCHRKTSTKLSLHVVSSHWSSARFVLEEYSLRWRHLYMRSFKEGCIIGTSFDQHEMEFDHSCNAHSLFSHLMFANPLSGINGKYACWGWGWETSRWPRDEDTSSGDH